MAYQLCIRCIKPAPKFKYTTMKKTIVYLALAVAGLLSACNTVDEKTEATVDEATEATADTAVTFDNEASPDSAAGGTIVDVDASGDADWSNLDIATENWEMFKAGDLEVRKNEDYSVYSLEENILFDTDKAEIKKGAEASLKEISTSIAERSKNGAVRVYGYTDARGSAGYNKQLAEQRAEAVKNWLSPVVLANDPDGLMLPFEPADAVME